jgi:hypothetical protein
MQESNNLSTPSVSRLLPHLTIETHKPFVETAICRERAGLIDGKSMKSSIAMHLTFV